MSLLAAFNPGTTRIQVATTTIDLKQSAAAYTLFTGTTQDVIVESLVIRLPDVNCADDSSLTSIKIDTDDTTAAEFITAVAGDVANLTAEAQLAYAGAIMVKVGTIIQLTIAGGAADDTTVCDVTAMYRAVLDGGRLV